MSARRSLREHESPEAGAATPLEARRARPVGARDNAEPVRSPARALQSALEAELEADFEPKWPPIARLAFIVGTCGGFWALVGWLVFRTT